MSDLRNSWIVRMFIGVAVVVSAALAGLASVNSGG